MPTLRSQFNLEQFEVVLQKLAYEVAVDAVTNLNHGDVSIILRGSRFDTVATDKIKMRFYPNHMSYVEEPTRNYKNWWGFDVEKKLYLTSNHCSKISFYAPEGEIEARKKKIMQFIENLMADAEISPEPRFSLTAHAASVADS